MPLLATPVSAPAVAMTLLAAKAPALLKLIAPVFAVMLVATMSPLVVAMSIAFLAVTAPRFSALVPLTRTDPPVAANPVNVTGAAGSLRNATATSPVPPADIPDPLDLIVPLAVTRRSAADAPIAPPAFTHDALGGDRPRVARAPVDVARRGHDQAVGQTAGRQHQIAAVRQYGPGRAGGIEQRWRGQGRPRR